MTFLLLKLEALRYYGFYRRAPCLDAIKVAT